MNCHCKIQRLFLLMLTIFLFLPLYAKEDIDSVLNQVSDDIKIRLQSDTILCVLEFSSPKKEMGEYIQSSLMEGIIESKNVRVVTRSYLDKTNMELNFHNSGYVSDETALDICKKLGANTILFGNLKELDNQYVLEVKAIDVESASYLLLKKYEFSRSNKSEQLLGRDSVYCRTSIGFGFGVNKNSLDFIAISGKLNFDYSFSRFISLGSSIIAGYDFHEKNNSFVTIEPLLFLRFYLALQNGEPVTGLFLEPIFGASILLVNTEITAVLNGGGGIGYRLVLNNFYIEPEFRVGYPYLFGVGLSFGIRF